MKKRLVWLLIFSLLSYATPAGATTYFIDNSGTPACSDSNAGTSQSAPWCNMPGMVGFTGSHTPTAGDRFILRGGDTWTHATLGGVWIQWNGTSGNPIYFGVDQTYFTGSSWVRPTWNCGGTNCGDSSNTLGAVVYLNGNFTTLDNIEITGYQYTGGNHLIFVNANNTTVENMYLHGWSHTTACNSGNDPYAIGVYNGNGPPVGDVFDHNVTDGSSDSTGNYCFGGILHGNVVSNNVIRFVYNGLNGSFDDIHGNLIEDYNLSTTGDHCNGIFVQDLSSASVLYSYNNIVRHGTPCGGTPMWLAPAGSGHTIYAYNNLTYDLPGEPACIQTGNHPPDQPSGTFFLYNNTCDAGGGTAFGNGETPQRFTTTVTNSHVINASALCDLTGTTCTSTTNLLQTSAQADANTSPHFDQYTASQSTPYSPVASTNSTVGAATNLSSLCAGSLAALCNDTAYATYNTANHTSVSRSVNSRGSTWDIGAFEYKNGVTGPTPVVVKSVGLF